MFPSLDAEQKRFAVNPSYAEFHADVFGQPPSEDSREENEEVVDNEPMSNDMLTYLYPKKASMKALMNEDPRVLASVIEDDQINDIYFTTSQAPEALLKRSLSMTTTTSGVMETQTNHKKERQLSDQMRSQEPQPSKQALVVGP